MATAAEDATWRAETATQGGKCEVGPSGWLAGITAARVFGNGDMSATPKALTGHISSCVRPGIRFFTQRFNRSRPR
jgi:hypothetical protein